MAFDCGSVAEDLGNEFDWVLPQSVLEEPVVETDHQNESNTQYYCRDQRLKNTVELLQLKSIALRESYAQDRVSTNTPLIIPRLQLA